MDFYFILRAHTIFPAFKKYLKGAHLSEKANILLAFT